MKKVHWGWFILVGVFIGLFLFGSRPENTKGGTMGGGEPCYPPTEKQSDGSCK